MPWTWGPARAIQGGRVLYHGTPAGLWQQDTPTGRFFSLRERVALPLARSEAQRFVTFRGAHLRNLQQIDVPIPVGRLTVITGVSGSGKSTLVEDVLVASLAARQPVGCARVDGPWLKPVWVNQDPIGINPRSVPATYTHLADIIRDLFAQTTGLAPSYFSFNRPEGACPTCKGMGAVEVHMRYLPTSWTPCPDCEGQRYNEEVLAARVSFGDRSLSIADVYALTIAEAAPLLLRSGRLPIAEQAAAEQIFQALHDVGLGYLTLGQPSPTLSGGEAQRVKLAKYLGQRRLSGQLLVLDEPSTGLHPQDVAGLLVVLDRLVRNGATVVVVEHNTDIIRAADWCIDLGPGAGPARRAAAHRRAARCSGGSAALADRPGPARRGQLAPPRPEHPPARARDPPSISIRGARANNLRDVDVDLPKGSADRGDGRLRLGQVEPGARRAGGRGAAALPGEPLALRAAEHPRGARGARRRRQRPGRGPGRGVGAASARAARHRGHGHRDRPPPGRAAGRHRRAALPAVRGHDAPRAGVALPDLRRDGAPCRAAALFSHHLRRRLPARATAWAPCRRPSRRS